MVHQKDDISDLFIIGGGINGCGIARDAAGRGLSVPMGQGTADFPELIGLLESVQFRGRYVVGRKESTIPELVQGIEYLTNL